MLARKWLRVFLLIIFVAWNSCLASRCRWAATENSWLHDGSDVVYHRKHNASLDECKAVCETTHWCHSVMFRDMDSEFWQEEEVKWQKETGYENVMHSCLMSKCGLHLKCEVEHMPNASAHDCREVPLMLIVIVLMSSLVISVIAFAALYFLLGFKVSESIVGSIVLFGIVVGFGAMPIIFSEQPNNCASFTVTSYLPNSYIFPLSWLSLAGSLIGMTMACLRLRSTAWRHLHALTRSTIIYFMLATGFNIVGLVGALLLSCVYEKTLYVGEILLGVWLVGSVGTTLTLHNLMSLRAEIFVGISAVVLLRRIVFIEVLVVISLCVLACVAFVARQGFGFQSSWFWVPLISTQGCFVFALFFMDLVFSWRVLAIFHNALKKVRASSFSSSLGNDTLTKSLRIVTLNIATVLLSVCTTSIFYLAALVFMSLEAAESRSSTVNHILLIAWVLDSLGNDACASYIGFGPTADALEIVASAGKADVIGNPLTPVAQQEHVAVVGHVLPPPNTTIPNPSAAARKIVL